MQTERADREKEDVIAKSEDLEFTMKTLSTEVDHLLEVGSCCDAGADEARRCVEEKDEK